MQKNVAVIRYNAGNIQSVLFALERLGIQAKVTEDANEIRRASHVIFPGVGAANSAMPHLRARGLDELICSLQQPFLGICLGMQLMCRHSEEGDTDCLGIFDIPVKKFAAGIGELKIPHMGWNSLGKVRSALLHELPETNSVYFVHSYYAPVAGTTVATCTHGVEFSAALQKDNFMGVQFHPEKSAETGEQILKNFLSL